MNKKTMFGLGILGLLLLITSAVMVSSYYCVNSQEDNSAVKEFKMKMNYLALDEDFKQGLEPNAIMLKLKYFNPCR